MGFQWEPTWQAYLGNTGVRDCQCRLREKKFLKRHAVTAACVLMNNVYDAVGAHEEIPHRRLRGLDPSPKMRDSGLEIACLPLPVMLIHLERQSFSGIGTPSFRDYVARYNACRHQARWGAAIAKLCGADKERGTLNEGLGHRHAHPDFSVGGADRC